MSPLLRVFHLFLYFSFTSLFCVECSCRAPDLLKRDTPTHSWQSYTIQLLPSVTDTIPDPARSSSFLVKNRVTSVVHRRCLALSVRCCFCSLSVALARDHDHHMMQLINLRT
uniref:Putative secreted peptide n=1 Tax=Anopheles braziliensis TaxID=58242 RepID=A0A2M3ZQG9_9DIPT